MQNSQITNKNVNVISKNDEKQQVTNEFSNKNAENPPITNKNTNKNTNKKSNGFIATKKSLLSDDAFFYENLVITVTLFVVIWGLVFPVFTR